MAEKVTPTIRGAVKRDSPVMGRLRAKAAERRPGDKQFAAFVDAYLTGYPDFDVAEDQDEELFASMSYHYDLAFVRPPGRVISDVFTPSFERDGWDSGYSYLYSTVDDMPFIVDTTRNVLQTFGVRIHRLIPPVMLVRRTDGRMVEVERGTTPTDDGQIAEAWTQIQIDRLDPDTSQRLADANDAAMRLVGRSVRDFDPMRSRMGEARDLDPVLGWLADDNFVFLGAATIEAEEGAEATIVEGRSLGSAVDMSDSERQSFINDPPLMFDGPQVRIDRAEEVSIVHRQARLTVVTVRQPDEKSGTVRFERYRGLLAASAYRDSVLTIPTVGERAREVLSSASFEPNSLVGRALRNVIESLPRELLFELDVDRLRSLVYAVVALLERQVVRVFELPEPAGDASTILVYLPRDRYSAQLTDRIVAEVSERLDSPALDVSTQVSAASLARIDFTLTDRPGAVGDPDRPDLLELAARIDELTTPWADRVAARHLERSGSAIAANGAGRVLAAASEEYRSAVSPAVAARDVDRLAELADGERTTSTALMRESGAPAGEWRVRIYQRGDVLSLTELLPMLSHLGFEALEEHPYEFKVDESTLHLLDIGVRLPAGVVIDERRHDAVLHALDLLIDGAVEPDGFNRLVLLAGLASEQVQVIRAYSKYARQTRFSFSQAYIENTLARSPHIARMLVGLFEARFDPDRPGGEERLDASVAAENDLRQALDEVRSLDDDRIVRLLMRLILATERTSAYSQRTPTIAFKFDPAKTPELPDPRPAHEIFVTSPRVEGVHLRGGAIARGGIRWSDRLEDYRTEVLGLVKAQMVKNSVIVPVGAKGGFVLKSIAEDASRAERLTEAQACYRLYISSLLDLTDNLVDGEVVHPDRVVRYDADDTYLVVAADKGTATFSDLANSVSAEYGFWLGDAFASGGSQGYDHKQMGITARGAWESAKRHGQVLDLDLEHDDFTAVGIGDMSGDVFGNGMLRSTTMRLIAAFDHRHVFVDPNPDPAASFAERKRLFELPTSSWADYDPDLISSGGGVFARDLKSVPVTAEMAAALGIGPEVAELTPADLIKAVLTAPVTMLWNGGIGTYIKASDESDGDVGDRNNDSVRVTADHVKAKMVVEGGNLGVTQRGRIEFALNGGLIYTDAIDNSAGVDTSDHEVNIKIVLDAAVANGDLSMDGRNDLLAQMTDEVADLVLDNNRAQTLALMIAREEGVPLVNVHARYLDALEADGDLDRSIEYLPTDKQIAERQLLGVGLRAPELAVLLAYSKNVNIVDVMASDVPDLTNLVGDVRHYFPGPLRDRFATLIDEHRLHRNIAATTLINQLTNISGTSYVHRMVEDTGAGISEVVRAWLAARDVLGFDQWWTDVLGAEKMSIKDQTDLLMYCRRAGERSSLWFLRHRRPPVDIDAAVEQFREPMGELLDGMLEHVGGSMGEALAAKVEEWTAQGAPPDLAHRAGVWPLVHTAFDIVEVAGTFGVAPLESAAIYWDLFQLLDLEWLWDGIGALPRSDRWQTQARGALRDDLLQNLTALDRSVLEHPSGGVDAWVRANQRSFDRTVAVLTEIRRADSFDITNLTVALRQLQNLAATSVRA